MGMIFGTKVHKDFPRKYLESGTCGDGFWPTDASGNYPGEGIMVEVGVDVEVKRVHKLSNYSECGFIGIY